MERCTLQRCGDAERNPQERQESSHHWCRKFVQPVAVCIPAPITSAYTTPPHQNARVGGKRTGGAPAGHPMPPRCYQLAQCRPPLPTQGSAHLPHPPHQDQLRIAFWHNNIAYAAAPVAPLSSAMPPRHRGDMAHASQYSGPQKGPL
eukprot:gene10987-biopygen6333